MSGLPGSPEEGEHPASSRGVSPSRKTGLPEDEPKQSKVWLRKVTQEQPEKSNYIFGDDHPNGHLCLKRRFKGQEAERETGVLH